VSAIDGGQAAAMEDTFYSNADLGHLFPGGIPQKRR